MNRHLKRDVVKIGLNIVFYKQKKIILSEEKILKVELIRIKDFSSRVDFGCERIERDQGILLRAKVNWANS